MANPPTMEEAAKRGLVDENGIHTFGNGTAHESWAGHNCWECAHWCADEVGQCAFEAYAFLGMVTPALARLFGWTRSDGNTQDGERFGWTAPQTCAFFRAQSDDDGNDNPPPPDPDPLQLVLLADPTEDIALANVLAPVARWDKAAHAVASIGRPATVEEVAERIGCHPSTASGYLTAATDRGLVTRTQYASGKRPGHRYEVAT